MRDVRSDFEVQCATPAIRSMSSPRHRGRPRSASFARGRRGKACPRGRGGSAACSPARSACARRPPRQQGALSDRELYGPNVAVEARRGLSGDVSAEVAEMLPERLAHEIGRRWPRGNSSGGGN